ncbi:MAG: four helix bundle protein [Syntrophaceae bacterium]|nr:four helix bundle protein [Syntrophaceae bacterium]
MRLDEKLNMRLLDFAVNTINLVQEFSKNAVGLHVKNQLLRAVTSPGANYEEACGAESRRDFCHKMGIVLKEIKETRYWLPLAQKIPFIKPASRFDSSLEEVEQLIAIFAKSINTAREKIKPIIGQSSLIIEH